MEFLLPFLSNTLRGNFWWKSVNKYDCYCVEQILCGTNIVWYKYCWNKYCWNILCVSFSNWKSICGNPKIPDISPNFGINHVTS